MKKKYVLLFLIVFMLQHGFSQQMVLKKGTILDALPVQDSIPDTFSLYLPTDFTTEKKWPLLLIFDLEGKEKQALSMFVQAAEDEGYVLAAPRVLDSISLSNSIVKAGKVLSKVVGMLPIHRERIYTAGASSGARFANLVPVFIKDVKGVVSIGSSIANTELLNVKRPFHFIGITNKNDFNFTEILAAKKVLDRFRFPNQVLLHEEQTEWPNIGYLKKSLQLFTLAAMAKGFAVRDSSYIEKALREDIIKVNRLKNAQKLLLAERYLGEMMSIYGAHKNLDSLRQIQKNIRKDQRYRTMRRAENAALFKESLLKEDYQYYIEEDVITHNFNNLGWWNYQKSEIDKFISGNNIYEKEMGNRLLGYINALTEDNIDIVKSEALIDEDALALLYMLKTILEPQNFDFYLETISLSSKNEDFGTALFYLEEALKNGFKDSDKLYGLEGTALLRITPKFNALVEKYLKDARYEIIEE
ncbi:alpha/beta hydrolase [Flagellimonas aquimarina]|uniref:Alpha/beta hydrolase n=1 Tax=Flagellimonas aquimarina TaxID=2201895 RepID=A0A316KVF8_9FLAO|nr:alpha/beta hydrolase [Allomuricauda koreensis]PWL38217.1 alpha/beta hydrolase [Allomuricauda koreensis]